MIEFTQYLMPDGRQKKIFISRAPAIEDMANRIRAIGLTFEAEMLSTGAISLTVTDLDNEKDIDTELIANGPEVLLAIDRLIERVFKTIKEKTHG